MNAISGPGDKVKRAAAVKKVSQWAMLYSNIIFSLGYAILIKGALLKYNKVFDYKKDAELQAARAIVEKIQYIKQYKHAVQNDSDD